jgi:hypothetical protein
MKVIITIIIVGRHGKTTHLGVNHEEQLLESTLKRDNLLDLLVGVRQVCQEQQALCIRVCTEPINIRIFDTLNLNKKRGGASEQTRTIAYALTMVHQQVHQTRHAHLSSENVLLK